MTLKSENTENIKMIPMEVDGDGNGGDSKDEGFLNEYNDTNSAEDGSGPFLPNSSMALKKNRRAASEALVRKHHFLVVFFAVILVFSAVALLEQYRTPVLRFRLENSSQYYSHSHYPAAVSNQTFKIMQITDIHLGEAESTDWGPKQDKKTFRLLEKIFEYEPDCDLIVLGGDQLTANNCLGNCTKYYTILGKFLSRFGVPWATIMGNHDDMDFEVEDGSGATVSHSYTRRDLLRVDRRFPLSLSQGSAPGEMTGVTNYVLDVLDPFTEKTALQLFFLDSGGGSLREAISDDQIKWLREKARATAQIPAVAFQHIPTSQHEYADGTCLGYQGEGVAELEYDGGIVDAMVESGKFHFLAVGHNHGNDYCCPYNNNNNNNNDNSQQSNNDLYFCFGRHSGYGGYGKWDRGVRIYEMLLSTNGQINNNISNEGDDLPKGLKWRTWVRLESGDKVDFLDYDHSTTEGDSGNE